LSCAGMTNSQHINHQPVHIAYSSKEFDIFI
jgi:hypothetical protein